MRTVLGDFLQSVRRERGWSQRELGLVIRAAQVSVARMETGGHIPPLKRLNALLSPLGQRARIVIEPVNKDG